jgi:hypothetical protein
MGMVLRVVLTSTGPSSRGNDKTRERTELDRDKRQLIQHAPPWLRHIPTIQRCLSTRTLVTRRPSLSDQDRQESGSQQAKGVDDQQKLPETFS